LISYKINQKEAIQDGILMGFLQDFAFSDWLQ